MSGMRWREGVHGVYIFANSNRGSKCAGGATLNSIVRSKC